MRIRRTGLGILLVGIAAIGALALMQPASAEPPDFCPRPFTHECEPLSPIVDPVVCTVICAGGPREITFRNAEYAACSGYILEGDCPSTKAHGRTDRP